MQTVNKLSNHPSSSEALLIAVVFMNRHSFPAEEGTMAIAKDGLVNWRSSGKKVSLLKNTRKRSYV